MLMQQKFKLYSTNSERSEKDASYSSTHFWQSGKFQTQLFRFELNFPFKSKSLEVMISLTPSLIGNAISISFIGLFLGPMYPITMNYASRILPRRILTGSIGWITGFGQAGSALFPFVAGAITSKEGISSLQPLCVFFFLSVCIFGKLLILFLLTSLFKAGWDDGNCNSIMGIDSARATTGDYFKFHGLMTFLDKGSSV